MSETVQHTPGPWRVEPRQWDHGASIAIVGATPEGSYIVAIIPPENEEDEPNMYTAKRGPCDLHNASLMATAPELLAELKTVREWINQLLDVPPDEAVDAITNTGEDVTQSIDDLIAKAEQEASLT